MSIETTDEGLLDMKCDVGGELLSEQLDTLRFENFGDMVERANEAGWRFHKDDQTGKWTHLCPEHLEDAT